MMMKKIVLGTLFVGLIAVLVAGGVIRTLDKTAQVEAQGLERGYGRGGSNAERPYAGETYEHEGAAWTGQGRRGQGGGAVVASQDLHSAEDLVVYEGLVTQPPASGVDLVILADDQEISVGTGPDYLASQGFVLQTGDPVQVQGFWEDGELKATQITRLSDGETITLRDQDGRPAWSGGWRGRGRQGAAP